MSFEERVREGFSSQPFMSLLNASLVHVEPGRCEIEVPFRPQLTQQHGFFHGGVIATLADNSGGFAGFSMMSEDEQPLSLEFKINQDYAKRFEHNKKREELHRRKLTLWPVVLYILTLTS